MIFRFMTKWNFLIYFFSSSSFILFVIWPHRTNFHLRQNVGKFLFLPSLPPMSPKNNKKKTTKKFSFFDIKKRLRNRECIHRQELLSLTYISFLFVLTERNKQKAFILSFSLCLPFIFSLTTPSSLSIVNTVSHLIR